MYLLHSRCSVAVRCGWTLGLSISHFTPQADIHMYSPCGECSFRERDILLLDSYLRKTFHCGTFNCVRHFAAATFYCGTVNRVHFTAVHLTAYGILLLDSHLSVRHITARHLTVYVILLLRHCTLTA